MDGYLPPQTIVKERIYVLDFPKTVHNFTYINIPSPGLVTPNPFPSHHHLPLVSPMNNLILTLVIVSLRLLMPATSCKLDL